jgi:hypothetical protein
MEMPQSGERMRGRDTMRAFQVAYPDHARGGRDRDAFLPAAA